MVFPHLSIADNSSQLAAGSVRCDRMHPFMYRLHLGLGQFPRDVFTVILMLSFI